MKNSPLYTLLYTIACCVIAALLLTIPPQLWHDRIQANAEFGHICAMMDAAGLYDPLASQQETTDLFKKLITPKKIGELDVFEARNASGERVALLFEIDGYGHEGPFKGILGITPDRQHIKGLRIYEHHETPGLGGMIAEPSWYSKLSNLPISLDGVPGIVIDSQVKTPNAVDSITGASTTTHSLEQAINARIHSLLAGGTKMVPLNLGLGPDAVTRATPGYPKGFTPPPNLRPLTKRPDFMVPEGLTNLALHKPVTSNLGDEEPMRGTVSQVTDGNKKSNEEDYVEMYPGEPQWVQIDLGTSREINCIVLWHYYKNAVVYRDVIVQIADDPDMTQNSRILFNNDYDNSTGLGIGADQPYFAGWWGEIVDAQDADHTGQIARYIRVYTNGGESDEDTRFVEIAAYGR